jgi:hypothetical protein
MVLLHFRARLTFYVVPKHALRELEGPRRLLPRDKGEHLEHAWVQTNRLAPISPKDKPLGSHMVG